MKKPLWLLGLLLLAPVCYADTPTPPPVGNPSWSIERAKEEAFQSFPQHIDPASLPQVDPDKTENQDLINQGGGKGHNREISVFSNGLYAVSTVCSDKTYYYYPNGRLSAVDISSSPVYHSKDCPGETPRTFRKYSMDGDLTRVGVDVGDDETYLFRKNGKFDTHWINDTCYGADGGPCGGMTPNPTP